MLSIVRLCSGDRARAHEVLWFQSQFRLSRAGSVKSSIDNPSCEKSADNGSFSAFLLCLFSVGLFGVASNFE